MRVLVVNNMAPFVRGGAEELADHLVDRLVRAGHRSEMLRVPFQWEPAERIPSQMLLARWLEVFNVDRVIALKFPAYLVRHPDKTLWLLHQYRQAYDLYDAGTTNISDDDEGHAIRASIRAADNEAFAESRHVFVNSEVTRDRLHRYNGVTGEILLPPVNDPEMFVDGTLGDYVFAGGRVNAMKRQHVLVEALALADPAARLVIAGPPDAPDDARRVEECVERLGVADRVHLDLRRVSRSEYAAYVRNSRAVAYIPVDEDSLGYVAMEGATAAKALITTDDSGGILGLVDDGVTGWVRSADPADLADAISLACEPGEQVREIGRAALHRWESFGVSWDATIEALLR